MFFLDVDECLDDQTNPCEDKDICVNTVGGAHCDCPAGSLLFSSEDGRRELVRCVSKSMKPSWTIRKAVRERNAILWNINGIEMEKRQ